MQPSASSWAICILAGGLSRRMGRDKSRLRLGGRALVNVIRAEAQKLRLPVRVIRKDIVTRCGPLGGALTALMSSPADVIIFLSCDAPFITARLLGSLRRQFKRTDTSLFVCMDERAGFPFILRKGALAIVKRQIDARQFSLQELARVLEAKKIEAPARWREQLQNINTPEDWAAAKARWRRRIERQKRR